ncbi:MAG: glycosyltransferase family 2 protein [Lachnospiraceae bacterium]|nr:glycosyltransferase family 2 protein [Lachnospiraceae bacterium]
MGEAMEISNDKKVIAVVVTYNRKELLRECISALISQKYDNCRVLIVDNNSTDGTRTYIDDLIDEEKVIYKNTGENLGGAGGFNYGIKEAAKMNPDFVWVMDDDCIVHNNTLLNFLVADSKINRDYGFLSSKVLWKDGNICTMNVQRKTLTKNVEDFNTSIVSVTMASFVSLFIPIKIIREFGLPIKDFFIWTDDWEYTRRISRRYPCYLVNKSIVTHKSANNIGASIDTDTEDRLERYNYLYRNDMYLYRREGFRGIAYEIPRLFVHIIRILKSDCQAKRKRITILIMATIKGLFFNPRIESIKNR